MSDAIIEQVQNSDQVVAADVQEVAKDVPAQADAEATGTTEVKDTDTGDTELTPEAQQVIDSMVGMGFTMDQVNKFDKELAETATLSEESFEELRQVSPALADMAKLFIDKLQLAGADINARQADIERMQADFVETWDNRILTAIGGDEKYNELVIFMQNEYTPEEYNKAVEIVARSGQEAMDVYLDAQARMLKKHGTGIQDLSDQPQASATAQPTEGSYFATREDYYKARMDPRFITGNQAFIDEVNAKLTKSINLWKK